MSKVLVDRELLERAMYAKDGKELIAANRELRAILDKPAEAEGVEVIAYATPNEDGDWQMLFFDEKEAIQYVDDEPPAPLVLQSAHLAALSAVTAERDRLRDQVKALQSDANSWQSGYDKGRHDGTKHRHSEVTQLRAEVEALRVALLGIASVNPAERGIEWAKAYASDGLNGTGSELYIRWLETLKEAEALRKDAVRWRYVRLQGDDTHWLNLLRVDLDEFGGNINAAVDALIDGEAPDMAAKEG